MSTTVGIGLEETQVRVMFVIALIGSIAYQVAGLAAFHADYIPAAIVLWTVSAASFGITGSAFMAAIWVGCLDTRREREITSYAIV